MANNSQNEQQYSPPFVPESSAQSVAFRRQKKNTLTSASLHNQRAVRSKWRHLFVQSHTEMALQLAMNRQIFKSKNIRQEFRPDTNTRPYNALGCRRNVHFHVCLTVGLIGRYQATYSC